MKDEERFIWLLSQKQQLSNQQVKVSLNLSAERYKVIRAKLIRDGLVELYQCRGGGVRLTLKGERSGFKPSKTSGVSAESELYPHFYDWLAAESEVQSNELSVVTAKLKKRGKWSNPDVIRLEVRRFPILRTHRVLLTTYEIKRLYNWDLNVVYEAASHRRFSNESYVVLEWSDEAEAAGIDDILAACGRFGVGLMTMHPYYKSYRCKVVLEAESHMPSENAVEDFLSYAFKRISGVSEDFQQLMSQCLVDASV